MDPLRECISAVLNNSHTLFDLKNNILNCLGLDRIQKAPQSMVGIWREDDEMEDEIQEDLLGLADLQNDVKEAINTSRNEPELRVNLLRVVGKEEIPIYEPHSPDYAPDNLWGGKKSQRKTSYRKKSKRKTHRKSKGKRKTHRSNKRKSHRKRK
jgi:hypothetical protein